MLVVPFQKWSVKLLLGLFSGIDGIVKPVIAAQIVMSALKADQRYIFFAIYLHAGVAAGIVGLQTVQLQPFNVRSVDEAVMISYVTVDLNRAQRCIHTSAATALCIAKSKGVRSGFDGLSAVTLAQPEIIAVALLLQPLDGNQPPKALPGDFRHVFLFSAATTALNQAVSDFIRLGQQLFPAITLAQPQGAISTHLAGGPDGNQLSRAHTGDVLGTRTSSPASTGLLTPPEKLSGCHFHMISADALAFVSSL